MKEITIKEILEAAGGRLLQGSETDTVTGIKHDSRELEAGDMFVAVIGQSMDGHRFIPQIIRDGCRAVLVSHTDEWFAKIGEASEPVSVILVDDTIEAMGRLAAWYLESLNIRRAAVTGSVGKTSTRDMIYYVLSEKYSCGRNLKNYNNNIGIPISVFRFDENTEATVLEMGMDAFGEIEYLSSIVKPHIGIITNIGVAHMEKLGSRDGIFRAKMEITGNIAAEKDGGTLIFPGDDEYLTKDRTKGDYSQIEIGFGEGCDFIISNVQDFGIEGIEFDVECPDESVHVRLPVAGTHNAVNGTVALACGKRMGVSLKEGAAGLAKAELTGSRLRKIQGKEVTIIDDTYNANPASMMSALDVLDRSRGARKVAILGDMFELGDDTESLHRSVGEHAAKIGTDSVIAIGRLAANIAEGAGGVHFPDKESFLKVMDEYIRPGDIVLVKASRGMHMEDIVGRLK